MNIVVFSGGTATNALTPCFKKLSQRNGYDLTYILPISDNGGSTSEILRILGGPAIGDIRSRIVRVMKDDDLVKLFGYRLSDDPKKAKKEWNMIVEGTHELWNDLPIELRKLCRAFLIHLQAELLKTSTTAMKAQNGFRFEKASVGNLFLTGTRLFLGSLDAAIELMMRLGRCSSKVHVIPCINTNHTHHISALLENGDVITGQSQISHPSPAVTPTINRAKVRRLHPLTQVRPNTSIYSSDTASRLSEVSLVDVSETEEEEEEEYANPIYILPELKNSQLHFTKDTAENKLPAPIKRILYINPYGEEIKPIGNSRAVIKLREANMIVYSIGSLMTSLLPTLILGNIAETIAERVDAHKILIVNNKYDRETYGLEGIDYLKMVIDSMSRTIASYRQSKDLSGVSTYHIPWNHYITDVVYLSRGEIQMDWDAITEEHGIICHRIEGDMLTNDNLEKVLLKITKSI